ncbi:MAG: pyridoxine 5'-phosphate synthase [Bacteroidales bacterium]|nr:pyridoxine 5'-phosphate synthase [Bacteroidales bacterium]
MTRLSVNINKIATLRNSRGGNVPDVEKTALDCVRFGAEGITVHPRPDERHIRYSDVYALKPLLDVEFNIEGNPIEKFVSLVCEVHPAQVTLVPDAHDAITSNAGWNTVTHAAFLKEICRIFRSEGIRTSIFVDPVVRMVQGAAEAGSDRIELYTQAYAEHYPVNREEAIAPYYDACREAVRCGLEVNAGHDLNLDNLAYLKHTLPRLDEVSIGHALICDALYMGLENTIAAYLKALK